MKNKYLKHFSKVLVVTIFTFILTKVMVFIPLNFSIFSSESIQKIDQFDVYSDLIQKSGIKPFDNKIIVVTVPQDGGRLILTEALNILSECHPSAIAVNVFLKGSVDPDIDEMLIDAVKNNNNVIFPSIYNGKEIINDSSLFDVNNIAVNTGFINISSDLSPYKHIFKTYINDKGKKIHPLALEAVRMTYPDKIDNLLKRKHDEEFINYKMDIPCISYEDIYSMPDMITGKIVIVGARANSASGYNSSDKMPDYMTQAHMASTVINECYIEKPSRLMNALFSIFMIMFFIHINLYFAKKFSNVSTFFIRLLTYCLFFAMVIGPYMLFDEYSYYFDCGQLLLAILFAPWAQDIYKLITIIFRNCYFLIDKYIIKRHKTQES